MKSAQRVLACEDGFSILTVLVSVVLVSIAIVALSGTTVYVLSLQTESRVRSTAMGIAVTYLEEVKTRPAESLASESQTAVNEVGRALDPAPFLRELIVQTGPDPKSKLITVRVHYPRGRTVMGKVELATIIYLGVGS
jgi:type II secretory pathway pseudopilin PulG